jgi:alpha-L-glutamate ligase-like protein
MIKNKINRINKINTNTIGLGSIIFFVILFLVLMGFELFSEHVKNTDNTIGYVENIRIVLPNGTKIVQARIDTGAVQTSIDEVLAEQLMIDNPLLKNKTILTAVGKQSRQTIPLKFYLNNKLIDTTATLANRSTLQYSVLVGRKDLNGFIIDTSLVTTNIPRERKIDILGITYLIPYGAMQIPLILAVLSILIVFTRKVIGIKTYGLFAPLIIALSFITMGLMSGLLIYFILLALGIPTDKLLNRLKLLSVSRASINLHLLTIFIGVVFLFLNLTNSDSFVLALPFIIMIHLIETFNKESDAHGTRSAVLLLLTTFMVASLSFFLADYFQNVLNQNQMFIIFIVSFVLSIFLAFYSGIRLTELTRFFKDKTPAEETIGHILLPPFLGMNFRNMKLVKKYNSTEAIELVNDKIKYKELLMRSNVPTPRMLDVISSEFEIRKKLPAFPVPFVIKPANGSAGKGIVIIDSKSDGIYYDNSGNKWSANELMKYMRLVLEGRFSMGLDSDRILVEEKIVADKRVAGLSETGLPDIRLIVFKGRVVAAMARLPTAKSGGKANLSQGALGANIDISSGKILGVYDKVSRKQEVPPPKRLDITLPYWKQVLEIGLTAAKLSGLGYAGVDIIYDRSGPMIMECNGHPGLEIQNVTGINILERVQEIIDKASSKGL